MQGDVCQTLFVVTQLSLQLRQLGQCGCELWVSSNIATAKDLCLLHRGDIANTSEDLARIWQDTFFREIDRRGEIIQKCAYVPFASQMLDTTTPPPVVDAPCLLDNYSSTVDAILKAVAGKATVPDLNPC